MLVLFASLFKSPVILKREELKNLLKNNENVKGLSPAEILETGRRCFTYLRSVQHDKESVILKREALKNLLKNIENVAGEFLA